MPYTPTDWVDGVTELDETRMDNIESGIVGSVAVDNVAIAANPVLENRLLITDTEPAFALMGDGEMQWGIGGSTAADVFMWRSGGAILETPNVFRAGGGFDNYNTGSYPSFTILANGSLAWADTATGQDTNLYRAAADTLKSDDGLWAAGGLATKVKAGVPTDSDLVAGMQQSGAMILDTTNSRIYFRVGSTWKYAALT